MRVKLHRLNLNEIGATLIKHLCDSKLCDRSKKVVKYILIVGDS